MKIKTFLMAVFAITLFIACSEQESNPITSNSNSVDLQKNWQERALTTDFFDNQKSVSHYDFSKKDIERAFENSTLNRFRFVLGLENNQIVISMVGVDEKGNELTSINSTVFFDSELYHSSIKNLENSSYEYSRTRIEAPIIGKHLLSHSATFDYVDKWSKALASQNIEEMITDSGVRYRYYTIEKEVIVHLISKANTESIALFLGLNAENELTTVLLGKDENNQLTPNNTNRSGDEIFDFTNPCPNACKMGDCPDGKSRPCGETCSDGSKPTNCR